MGTVIKLPSGIQVEISPIDGKTERMLEDKKLVQSGAFIDKYLASRIVSIDGDDTLTPQKKEKAVLDMLSGDRNFLLYKIRVDSYGPEMIFNQDCPECKKTNGYKVDLDQLLEDEILKVYPYRTEPIRVELPRSGGYAEIQHMTGHDERKMAQFKDNPLSGSMLLRTSILNGHPPTRKEFDELVGEDLAAIRGAIKESGKAGLVALLELDCQYCGKTYEVGLASIPDFFVPTKTNTESATE
jgi:hypothetical protein